MQPTEDSADECLRGGGESGALLRSIDWAQHPLGPVSAWPLTLRTVVRVMLASRFAMRVLWGPEYIFLYNDGYRPILGASKHPGAMGSRTAESFRELWHIVGPMFDRVRAGEAVALDDSLLPLDRNGFLEDCYFTLSYSPVRDDAGAVDGVLGVVHETTERVLSARRLATLRDLAADAAADTEAEVCARAIEALGRNPDDVASACLYLLDADGRGARLACATAPAPERFDLDADEASGAGGALVLWGAGRALVLPLARARHERPRGFLVVGLSPRLPFDERYRGFVEMAAGHIGAALARAAATALSAQIVAQKAALEDALRVKDDFLATLSHELRTPLNAIVGWTRMLRVGRVADDRRDAALATIERNAAAQTRLVEDLLDVSRIISGKLRLRVGVVDLAQVVTAAVETMRPAAQARGIRVQAALDPGGALVNGDPDRLGQVATCLLSNAVKFSAPDAAVTVALAPDGAGRVRLRVSDEGVGIGPALLPHVFDRFRQGDQSITRRHGGLGLGLSIARHLVELHGGTLTAESPGEERGATFTVLLPGASAPSGEEIAEAVPAGR